MRQEPIGFDASRCSSIVHEDVKEQWSVMRQEKLVPGKQDESCSDLGSDASSC